MPARTPASWKYLVGTALLAGVMGASFAFLAARLLGVSAVIAPIVTGVVTATYVGYVIHRDGRPNEES